MKFASEKKSKDSYLMGLEADLQQGGKIVLGHHDEDELIISHDQSVLKIQYRWEIQQDKPVQEGRYRVLLSWKRRNKFDVSYSYPTWQVAIWDGKSWTLPYLYPVEVGYGYDTFYRDVSDRVIRWEKLPYWMPVEVVQ